MRKKLLRSRAGFEKPESREEAIMQNILGASNVLEPSESNIEEILKSILYNTPYTKEAEFEIEKILLAIKNNGTYDGECESRDMKILFAILKGLDYTKEAESRIEELFIEWLHQRSSIKVLEGVPPLTFTSRGLPLINYLIEGNTIQNGTPSPDNPIMPQGCGDLETVGTKAGQYKIPISSAGQTNNIYLGEVQTTRIIKKLVLTGEELWGKSGDGIYAYFGLRLGDSSTTFTTAVCTHYENVDVNKTSSAIGFMLTASSKNLRIRPNDVENVTVNDFISYLAQQYANDTPVTIWYVLATPETGVVNEPLMKIGENRQALKYPQTTEQR